MRAAFLCLVRSAYGKARGLSKALIALMLCTLPLSAQERHLLAFGDSLTAGYGLTQGTGFVPRLEAWLRTHGAQVSVVNAGLSGDTSAGGAARIDWSLTPEIDAVLLELGGNDLLRAIAPEDTRANLAAILDAIAARDLPVLLIGLEAPANYGASYKTAFDAIYETLAKERGLALYPDFFAALKVAGSPADSLASFMQADGLHPNEAGVALIVQDIGPHVRALLAE